MNKTPKFSISILAMNGLPMTKRCIESVMKHSKNYEILLTDNGSSNGTAEYFDDLSLEFDHIHVTHNEENKGFSEPNNEALTRAKGRYLILLNNDTEVPKNWLNLLEQPFLTDMECAITGPTGSPCSFQHPFPSFHGSAGPNLEYIEGSCLCIPTGLAREIGLFANYLYFAYGEDADLSLRMRARGRTVHQVPFKLVHHRSQTASQIDNIAEIQHRNHEALMKRWGKYLEFRRFDLPFVVRRREAIGDVLLTTPLIAELRHQSPTSEIYVETNHPELFRDNPAVTKAGIAFPEVYRWATLIDLDMSYENQPETNIVDAYFKTACIQKPTGDFTTLMPSIYPNKMDLQTMLAVLGKKKWVAIHPGPTTWAGKNWAWARWESLCRTLMTEDWRVLLVGTPGPSLPHFMDLRGKTDFHQLAAALRYCRLFVGVDSFPMHVAIAMGGQTVGLFGATDPRFILPPCVAAISVCGTAECAGERHRVAGQTYVDCDGACMNSITVEQVLAAIQKTTK